MPTEKDLEHQIKVLEQRLQLCENDPSKRGYFALVKIANQQINVLNSFDLPVELPKTAKDDKTYDRTKALWEGLRGIITDIGSLKTELKIGVEDEIKNNNQRTTPESIANEIGENKQQDV